MATIDTSTVESSQPTAVYTSTGDTAITWASFTNYSTSTVNLTIHIVPQGNIANNQNMLVKNLQVTAGDTYQLYAGSEKILLSDGDTVQAVASAASSVNSIISFASI
jgi:hypothetical protein